jgi:tetratricopeptide (TPR) repeat protein
VHADDLREARRHFAEGQRHYGTGDWAGAFAAYEAAYEAAPLPALLFNMGQCQRKLGDGEAALDFFRRFLETGPPAESRALVMDLVRELEAQRPPESPPDAPAPPPPPETGPEAEDPPDRIVTPLPVRERVRREPDRGGPTAAFWLAGGTGAAALIAAGVLTALAEAGRAEFLDRVEARDLAQAEEVKSDTDTLYVTRNVTAVVSAAALVGAAILLLIGSGSEDGDGGNLPDEVAFEARLAPGGVFLGGRARW